MEMTSEQKQWAITGAVVVLVLLLGWWGMIRGKAASPVIGTGDTDTSASVEGSSDTSETPGTEAVASTDKPADATAVASGETVTVEDQAFGTSVKIAQASLKSASWIAIRDTKGWILGAGWFGQGGENLEVPLLRATTPGEVYQAVIYVDNGDKQFDFHTDSLVVSSEGAPVASTFRTE